MSAPLKVGEVHVRNEEDRLGVEINEGLENRDIHSFVRGKQRYFDIRNLKKKNEDTTVNSLHMQTGYRPQSIFLTV